MPRAPKLLAGLSLANGCLTLVTALVFAGGEYGAFRPQDAGGFRAIAGLLAAFAVLAFVAFAAAARLQVDDRLRRTGLSITCGLAAVVALGNAVLRFSPFCVPDTLHLLTATASTLVFCVAAGFLLSDASARPHGPAWPVWMVVIGSVVGGIALIEVGRYELPPGTLDPMRSAGIVISIIGLTLFTVGTGALAMLAIRGSRPRRSATGSWRGGLTALAGFVSASCLAASWTGIRDLDREGVGFGRFADVGNPWSCSFWLLVAATMIAAIILGGTFAQTGSVRARPSEAHPA